jgi:23S rRNA pseudouridine1911/1915/1917 synthase
MAEKFKIVYEDEWLIVLDKQAGIVVTDEGRSEKESIEKILADKIKIKRSGIVHRLDKGTSGLLLVAKTAEVLADLKKQFKERKVTKRYLALVCGEASQEGREEVPIGRSRHVFGKFGASFEGNKAITEFKVLKRFESERGKMSLISINLLTGRTHQIRVHMSYLKWPLLGDKQYGGWKGKVINRPFLQAAYISFWHPGKKKQVEFESDLADDLKEELKNYE